MGGIAASGGYYLSMAVGDAPDTIFAERTTWTGSIGVIIPHFTIADLLESWKIQGRFDRQRTVQRNGQPHAEAHAGNGGGGAARYCKPWSIRPSTSSRKWWPKARPQLANNKNAFAKATTGQVFTAKQALDLGLVDKLGFQEDAVDRAIDLANLDRSNVRVVKYTAPEGLLDSVLFGPSAIGANRSN